jgi:hypothetical protein
VRVGGTDPGDFRVVQDDCSGTSVAPGASCAIGVAFDPGAAGAKGAQLEVVADDPGLDEPAATAALAGTASAKPVPPQPPPQPVPTPIPSGTAQADCGPSEVTGLAIAGAGTKSVNGVRQPFATHRYDGDMVVAGTTSCASGMRVSLWGPELGRRSAALVSAAASGASATTGLRVHARATVQSDGSFRLPTDTRAPGQYFVALDGTIPQAGAPLWLRINPVLKAERRGSRVIVFAGPPMGTAGAGAVLERRAGSGWKRVSAGRVSRRARVSLAGGRTKGALRVRLVASKALQSLQPDLIVQARTTVR